MTPKLLVRDVSEYADLPDGLDRIEDVYIFDDDVRVHIASFLPSIECEHIYTVLHFADDLDDATREEYNDKYGHPDLQVDYFSPDHSGIVDLKDSGLGYDDWEEIIEYYRCNHSY